MNTVFIFFIVVKMHRIPTTFQAVSSSLDLYLILATSQTWWLMPAISALEKLDFCESEAIKDSEFQENLVYNVITWVKKLKKGLARWLTG